MIEVNFMDELDKDLLLHAINVIHKFKSKLYFIILGRLKFLINLCKMASVTDMPPGISINGGLW